MTRAFDPAQTGPLDGVRIRTGIVDRRARSLMQRAG